MLLSGGLAFAEDNGGLDTIEQETTDSEPVAPSELTVAALQYGGGHAEEIDENCKPGDDNCAVEALVRAAVAQGAGLVVLPEYGLDQDRSEPEPDMGTKPRDAKEAPLLTRFSTLAEELQVYLVVNLQTLHHIRPRNSQVAFDPSGQVVGKHHKVELFDSEREALAPGTGVMAFDTPFGRVGLLICADLYGDPRLHERLTGELDADIVAVSSRWTVPGPNGWHAAFARDWNVHLVVANASRGAGRGGGVFGPSGAALAVSDNGSTAFATLLYEAISRD